jgi:hypothetical protein
MASAFSWISDHFLEIFGLSTLILHAAYFLLKGLEPVLDEARKRYMQIKSWKVESRPELPDSSIADASANIRTAQPKTRASSTVKTSV